MERNKKKMRRAAGAIVCCVLVAVIGAAAVLFGRLGLTLVGVKCDAENGVYVINYHEDYKLGQLLDEGGVTTQDELAKYLIRILRKGLPVHIDYDVPSLACSTFIAGTPEGGYLFGRNLDNQDTEKTDVDTTLAIRILLDRAATVEEAIALLRQYDMHASAGGCYHFQIADASGRSVVVEYIGDEMVVVEQKNGFLAATNFYLSEVPFDYEAQGMDRYDGMKETLTQKNGVLTREEAMALLQKVALTGTAPDAQGRSYSTQWSSVYDLTQPSLTLCADRNPDALYHFSVTS